MAQNVDVFENALTKATDFKEIRVITSDNKSQSVTKEKFVELIDALVVARLKTLNIENNPTGIVVQNGTRFGSMTPQNLASVLGVPKIVNSIPINDLPSFTIEYCVLDPNAPMDYFICLTLLNSHDGAQLGMSSLGTLYSRFKSNGQWGGWKSDTI